MASAVAEQAMAAARAARADMGFGLDGPLPDLLAAVEGPGGAHVVVLDLGDDVAGACLQRDGLVLLFVNRAQDAVRRWARGRRIALDEVVRLAAEYGVSAKMARIRLETAGVLRDRALADRLDAEIDRDALHLPLAGLLGLEDLADGIAAAAAPRLPPALQGSALGGVLAGELTVAQAAARSGRSQAAMRRALVGLGLDRLLPIV